MARPLLLPAIGEVVTAVPRQYPIIDVSDWPVEQVEPAGRGTNTWLAGPNGGRWLHKLTRVRADRREGQEWAEKISAELGSLVGIPTARIELARLRGDPGCISADLKPGVAWELQAGSVLIAELVPSFISKTHSRQGHNLANIEQSLRTVVPSVGTDAPEDFTGFDLFCGYLLFDGWIANQDRHVENWSVLRGPSGAVRLAPSYDHGSTLGFNLTDSRRVGLLSGQDTMAGWLGRGRAEKFEDGQEATLVEFAHRALSMVATETRDYWLDRFSSVTEAQWRTIIEATPEMSEQARTFVDRMLHVNRRRILDASN